MDEGTKLIEEARYIINNYHGEDRVLHIRAAMNKVYKYYKSVIKTASFSDKRLINVFSLERLMKNEYLPLESTPDFDPSRNIIFPNSITSEFDCIQALQYIVHETRMEHSKFKDVMNDPLEKCCINSSIDVDKVCKEKKVTCQSFGLGMDLKIGMFHYFNIVSFNLGNGEIKEYIVDCTYRQFFTLADSFPERIGMPLNSGINIGRYMMMDERRKEIAEELLVNGFIECTPEVVKAYLDGFIVSGRNALYYESLGKTHLTKEDFVPSYTYEDYMNAIVNNIPLPESDITNGRFRGISNLSVEFDTLSDEHYLGTEFSKTL